MAIAPFIQARRHKIVPALLAYNQPSSTKSVSALRHCLADAQRFGSAHSLGRPRAPPIRALRNALRGSVRICWYSG